MLRSSENVEQNIEDVEDHTNFTRQEENVVGRIYTVSSNEGERFNLLTILLHVSGSTSCKDSKMMELNSFPTYRETCLQLDVIADDSE